MKLMEVDRYVNMLKHKAVKSQGTDEHKFDTNSLPHPAKIQNNLAEDQTAYQELPRTKVSRSRNLQRHSVQICQDPTHSSQSELYSNSDSGSSTYRKTKLKKKTTEIAFI